MWKHALPSIVCPNCKSNLDLLAVEENNEEAVELKNPDHDNSDASRPTWVETGLLSCDPCKFLFPIYQGVPILLKYKTQQAELGLAACPDDRSRSFIGRGFRLPSENVPIGEEFVSSSFSVEWENYNYGPVIWIASTAERLETFRGECGLKNGDLSGKRFIEIGCGLGILTNEAASGLGAEAWGLDLSGAVFRAAKQFRNNPQAHFVQSSVFAPPFKERHFDYLYSHGVLHHTWSTKEAVREAVKLLKINGCIYIWLYGYGDVYINRIRKVAYMVEEMVRPVIAKMPSMLATATLLPLVPAYQIASLIGKKAGTHGSVYTMKQALHAARDRFTPLFAHRHDYEEVVGWFKEFGFKSVRRVCKDDVSPSWGLAMERNVAIRAVYRG